jgi:hypothetical protein
LGKSIGLFVELNWKNFSKDHDVGILLAAILAKNLRIAKVLVPETKLRIGTSKEIAQEHTTQAALMIGGIRN